MIVEVVNGDRGKNYPSKDDRLASGIPFVSAGDLRYGRARRTSMEFISIEHHRRLRSGHIQEDDIILCIRGSLGRFALATQNDEPGAISSSLVILRPQQDLVNPRFLASWIESPIGQNTISSLDNGAAQPNVGAGEIAKIRVPLPPLAEQNLIGQVLTALDDLIENNRRRIEILEEMTRLLYREWFVHFRFPGHEDVELVDSELGPIPDGWEVSSLKGLLTLTYGKGLKASDRLGGSVEVYGSGGLVGHHDEYLATGPGIIVGRKGNVGALYWSDSDYYAIDTTYFVETDLPMYFVYQLLGTLTFINSHAAVPGLSRDQAYGLETVTPPRPLTFQYAEHVQPMIDLRRNLIKQNRVLRETRDLLLPRLVSGELDVSDLDLDGLLS